MINLANYIIQESFRSKIHDFFNKFIKDNSSIKETKTLESFKDTIITEKEADEIADIKESQDKKNWLFGSGSDKEWYRLVYKQAMLDFAYRNFSGTLDFDPFGENGCDTLFNKIMKLTNNRGIGLICLARYFYGFGLAKELNLKCTSKIELDLIW